MAILAYDDVMLREPRLLARRMQPLGLMQIDRRNSISSGLCFAEVFSKGVVSNAVGGGARATLTGSPSTVTGTPGIAVSSEAGFGNIYRINHGGLTKAVGPAYTVMIHGRLIEKQGAYAGFFTLADESANHAIGVQVNAANNAYLIWVGNLASENGISTSSFPATDITLLARGINAHTGATDFWLSDGTRVKTTLPGTPSAAPVPTRLILFGERSSNTGYTTKGRCYAAAVWNRWLSDAECVALHSDPYQFLIPA